MYVHLCKISLTQIRIARVTEVIASRVRLSWILDADNEERWRDVLLDESDGPEAADVWYDHRTPLIFPVGWAVRTGYTLLCTEKYRRHCERIVKDDPTAKGGADCDAYRRSDARPDHFDYLLSDFTPPDDVKWERGMKCELLDMNPDTASSMKFRVATVKKVLTGGDWLCMQCDDYDTEEDVQNGNPIETYPVHVRSTYLVPFGTATQYELPLCTPLINGTECVCTAARTFQARKSTSRSILTNIYDEHVPRQHQKHSSRRSNGIATRICSRRATDLNWQTSSRRSLLRRQQYAVYALDGLCAPIRTAGTKHTTYGLTIGEQAATCRALTHRSPDLLPVGWCEMVGVKLHPPRRGETGHGRLDDPLDLPSMGYPFVQPD
jgi:hypothetical protein